MHSGCWSFAYEYGDAAAFLTQLLEGGLDERGLEAGRAWRTPLRMQLPVGGFAAVACTRPADCSECQGPVPTGGLEAVVIAGGFCPM